MLNTCIFDFKQVGHRYHLRSEWTLSKREEVDRKNKTKKKLLGRRGASHPHKIVKLCFAPWLQPVDRTGEGSRVEKCIKDEEVSGRNQGGRVARWRESSIETRTVHTWRAGNQTRRSLATRKWTVSRSEDGETAKISSVALQSHDLNGARAP